MSLPARPGRPEKGRDTYSGSTGAPGQEGRSRHQLTLRGRESLVVDGVANVESFDDQEVVVETDQGLLFVRGSDLSIKELNLETGNLVVTGFITALEYTGAAAGQKRQGLLRRLFK